MNVSDALGIFSNIIDGLLAIGAGIMGWLIRTAHRKFDDQAEELDRLRDDHNDFKNSVANDYLKTSKFDTVVNRIDDKLDDIMRILISRNNSK